MSSTDKVRTMSGHELRGWLRRLRGRWLVRVAHSSQLIVPSSRNGLADALAAADDQLFTITTTLHDDNAQRNEVFVWAASSVATAQQAWGPGFGTAPCAEERPTRAAT